MCTLDIRKEGETYAIYRPCSAQLESDRCSRPVGSKPQQSPSQCNAPIIAPWQPKIKQNLIGGSAGPYRGLCVVGITRSVPQPRPLRWRQAERSAIRRPPAWPGDTPSTPS